MNIGIIGVSHLSSSLELRENLTRAFEREFGVKSASMHSFSYVLLSTCNRTEIYFSSRDLPEVHAEVLKTIRKEMSFDFEHALYSFFGDECFLHLAKVISGMNSAIFGESDIQRQVKKSYEHFHKYTQLTESLHFLFQKGLKIGKEMRTAYIKSDKTASLPKVIESLVNWTLPRVLFVGNSAINRKIITYFSHLGHKELTLCSRMEKIAPGDFQIRGWDELALWREYDVVICATHSEKHLISFPKEPSSKKVVLFDLSVPRVIDPKIAKHPNLYLYNIDDLGGMQPKREMSFSDIELCEFQIEKLVARQLELFANRRKAKWKYGAVLEFALSS